MGYLYFMARESEYQIGISNRPFGYYGRIENHERDGWELIEILGPWDGQVIYEIEKSCKTYIRKHFGNVERTRENWYCVHFSPKNFEEIFLVVGVKPPRAIKKLTRVDLSDFAKTWRSWG